MNERPAPVEPVEAPTSDEEERLLKTARAAQIAGTFPSDSAIRLFTDGYGASESERRHCMAAARLALAYWREAWGCLSTNCPAPAEPADHIRNATEMVATTVAEIDAEWLAAWSEETGRYDVVQFARNLLAKFGQQPTPPAEGEVGELVAWLQQRCQLMSEAPGSEFHLFSRAADLLQEQAAELATLRRQAGPPAEGVAWQTAAALRRLSAQNPMGSADPTLLRAAELLERLAGQLAVLRQERPHG